MHEMSLTESVVEILVEEDDRASVLAEPVVPLEHAEKEPLIFFVGALQKRKNVVRLIEAFENVPSHLVDVPSFWQHSIACARHAGCICPWARSHFSGGRPNP